MNIIVCIDYLSISSPGGASNFSLQIASKLAKNSKHQVFFVAQTDIQARTTLDRVFGSVNYIVYCSKNRKNIFDILNSISHLLPKLMKLQRTQKIDLINLHHPLFFPLLKLVFRKIPFIYTFHSPWHLEYLTRQSPKESTSTDKRNLYERLRFYLEHVALRHSVKVTTLSNYMADLVKSIHKVPHDKIVVTGGSVDLDKFKPAEDKGNERRSLNIPLNKRVIFTARSLIWRTGVDLLIDAMAILKDKLPPTEMPLLFIAGYGYMVNELKEKINDLKLGEFVKLLGVIKDAQLVRYYQAADLVVIPSRDLEGFGLVVIEALSCGCPVMATPQGGMIEIIEKFDKRFLFKGKTAQDIAVGILCFFQELQYIEDLPLRCRKFVEKNYNLNRTAECFEELYYRITDSRSYAK